MPKGDVTRTAPSRPIVLQYQQNGVWDDYTAHTTPLAAVESLAAHVPYAHAQQWRIVLRETVETTLEEINLATDH